MDSADKEATDLGCFYLEVNEITGPGAEDYVRAFIWLKRRIEERGRSGTLLVPDREFLATTLREALGWRLIELLEEEGQLSLGEGLALHWSAYSIQFRIGPAAALLPRDSQLTWLHEAFDPLLVVPDSPARILQWRQLTSALPAAREVFS